MPGHGMPIDPYKRAVAAPKAAETAASAPAPQAAEARATPSYSAIAPGAPASLGQMWPFNPRNPYPEGKKEALEEPQAPARPEPRPQAAPAQAPAPAAAVPEDYEAPAKGLRPAGHLYDGHVPKQAPVEDKGGMGMLLQLLGLGAAIYLWKFSELPSVLGLRRKH
jgi:hypothetical protein